MICKRVRGWTSGQSLPVENFFEYCLLGFWLTDWLTDRVAALASVVRNMDNAIHRINHYPVDSAIGFRNVYPLDSDLFGG